VSAAMTWVIIDEHLNSINDSGFGHPGPNAPNVRWVDFPAVYHNKAGGLAFADGHSEIKKWKGLNYPASGTPPSTVTPGANRADWDWLAERSTQRPPIVPAHQQAAENTLHLLRLSRTG